MGKGYSKYEDIINMQYHQSKKRPQMSLYNRAAQFCAFEALQGYGDMVQDKADILLLDQKAILDEDRQSILDRQMQVLMDSIKTHPEIKVIYFNGTVNNLGVYSTHTGKVKKVEEYPAMIIFEDGKKIMMEDIIELDVDLLAKMVKEQ